MRAMYGVRLSRFRDQKIRTERDVGCSARSKGVFWGRRKWAQASRIRRPWRGVRVGLKQMPWKQDFGGYIMENSTTGALGGEARWGPKMSKKWWETVARLAPERLQPGVGNSGFATVRRGASGSCPGAFRGAFGAPKSALGELSELRNRLSEPFERPFRWHVRFQSWSLALRSTRDD